MAPGLYSWLGLGMTVCGLTMIGSGLMRRYALAKQVLDVPNERSSHAVATPRGAGVAIAASVLLAIPCLGLLDALAWSHVRGLFGAGLIVAIVGFADDRWGVAAAWRLLVHTVAALMIWAVAGPGAAAGVTPPAVPSWLGASAIVLFLVWMINLTNFMDGIDGLAAVETITVAGGGVALATVAGAGAGASAFAMMLIGAGAGFLVWNWPPARVFMGDAGSGFLGLMLGAAALLNAAEAPALFWGWIILLAAFVADTTVTLLRRLLSGRAIHEAHREHAYQHAAHDGAGHLRVTLSVGVINLFWLLPIGLLTVTGRIAPFWGVAVAYLPLVVVAILLGAGTPAKREPLLHSSEP